MTKGLLALGMSCLMAGGSSDTNARADAESASQKAIEVKAQPMPTFPSKLLSKGIHTGSVVVALSVDELGYLTDWLVLEATDREFALAVAEVIDYWTFEPAKRGGIPFYTEQMLPIYFSDAGGQGRKRTKGRFSISDFFQDVPSMSPAMRYRLNPIVFANASELDEAPTLLFGVEPRIPAAEQASCSGEEAVFEFYVDQEGNVRMPTLLEKGEGVSPLVTSAAQYALEQWRFEPLTKAGQPVVTKLRQRFIFNPSYAQFGR
ncbi:energy transducer TonB [Pelagicoccus sp. SDUM812003]|uniref:energy transducer TonB n=1 Tax=Pelagicoccus sp. SDUM812003 TaxID=3041267 RepID=UPI0028108C61|nr:energy transducer TonB [Pelagicoccus sp. SDUM812003]MDQ8203111.1 energy transducer TonB [Pelagicoccus sp. SDUM812003]